MDFTQRRRTFLRWSAAAGVGLGAVAWHVTDASAQGGTDRPGGQAGEIAGDVPAAIRALRPMTAGIVPITNSERLARIEKARRLMTDNGIGAIILEGGSSLFYFTGVRWGLSERPFVAVLPAKGEPAWVGPGFEEARARELIEIGGKDVRTWQEDESPYRLVAQILKDRGVSTGRVGVEERLRFFVFNGVKKEAPAIEYVSADLTADSTRQWRNGGVGRGAASGCVCCLRCRARSHGRRPRLRRRRNVRLTARFSRGGLTAFPN